LKLSRSCIQSRYLWAFIAGLLLAASFPGIGIAGLAWVAPGLILASAIGRRGKAVFRVGYVAGLAHYLASLSWLLRIPVPTVWVWAPALGWFALGAFLALYPAVWVWLCWKTFPTKLTGEGNKSPLQNCAAQFLSVPWAQRIIWAGSCAALWVSLEMTVARFLGGFPWNLLGDSQFRMLPLIHIAAFTGVYGVSFLVVWTSLSFMSGAIVILGRPAMRSVWLGEIILPMLAVAAIYGTGYEMLLRPEPKAPELSIALVQPSIPQSLIWDKNAEADRFKQLIALSESALTNKPDLLIWPEAAVPGLIRVDDQFRQPILDLARSHKTWIIIGADDFTPHPGAKTFADCDFFNSSFVINPQGEIVGEYRKRNLVIFGEYVPLTRWLPFLKHLTPITGGFTPGDGPVPFHLDNLNVNVSVLICFEDIFPHLAREYVSDDTDFLVNLTNNGWFGEGAAQWQHAAAAIFRAIENGLPLVRCANNGVTCWADAHGRLKWFESASNGIYGPGFMIVNVPVLAPGEKRAPTFYRLHGDRFGWGCVAFALLQILRAFARDHKSRPSQPLPSSNS